MKIREKILVSFLLVSIIPVVAGSVFIYYVDSSRIYHNTIDELEKIADSEELKIKEEINLYFDLLNSVSSRTQLRLSLADFNTSQDPQSLSTINKIINDAVGSIQKIDSIYIINNDGNLVSSTENSNDIVNVIPELYDELNQHYRIIDVQKINGENFLILLSPLQLDEQQIGSVIITIPAKSTFLENYNTFDKTGEVFLGKKTTQNNISVISSLRHSSDTVLGYTIPIGQEHPLVHALDKNEGNFEYIDYRHEPVLSVYRYVDNADWGLVVKIDKSEAFEELDILFITLFGISTIVIVLVAVISILISRRISDPIVELNTALKNIEFDKLETKILPRGNDEISNLAKSFNTMAERLSKAKAELKKKWATEHELETLQQADLLKEEFSTMIAHELKTPLVPILGNVDFVKNPKMIDKLDSVQLEAINSIEKNAKRLEGLISDLLDAQKIHLNKMKFNKSALNVKEFMESVRSNLTHYTKEKQITFVNNTPDSFELVTDENRLRQVIGNLVKNSVDFVPGGGKIEIGATVSNDEVQFYVKDNGVGIPQEQQPHLFKKFYQVDTSIRRKHGGTGLGLVICKGIVEGLGGKIWFESKEGVGTTFYFTIPLEGQKVKVKSS